MPADETKAVSTVLTEAYARWQRHGTGIFGQFALGLLQEHGYGIVPRVDAGETLRDQIRPYVQEAINNRRMGISLTDQIVAELHAAGYTLVQEQIREIAVDKVNAGNVRMTPIKEDGSPDPSKPVVSGVLSGASIEWELKDIGNEVKRLLFGPLATNKARYPHQQARRVVEVILPKVLKRYLEKSRDYEENAQSLGLKGQFADINRKFVKLKRAWWYGKPLTSEPAEEVAQDMIAHLLLSLLFIDELDDDNDE